MPFRPIQAGKHHIQYSSTAGETMSPKGLKPGELAVNSADGSIAVVGPDGLLTTLTGPNASVTAKQRSTTSALQGAYYPAEGEVILNETTGTLWGFDRKSPGGAPQSDEQAMASGRFWATSWNADGTIRTGAAAVDDYKSGTLYAYNPGTQAVEPYTLGDAVILRYGNYTGTPSITNNITMSAFGGTARTIEYSNDNVNWSTSIPALPAGTWDILRIRYTGDDPTVTLQVGSRFDYTQGITSPHTQRVYSTGSACNTVLVLLYNVNLAGFCTLPCGWTFSADGTPSDPSGFPHVVDWCAARPPKPGSHSFINPFLPFPTVWVPPYNAEYILPASTSGYGTVGSKYLRGDISDYVALAPEGTRGVSASNEPYLYLGLDKVPPRLIWWLDNNKETSTGPVSELGYASLAFIDDWLNKFAEKWGYTLGRMGCSEDCSGRDITVTVRPPITPVKKSNNNTLEMLLYWPDQELNPNRVDIVFDEVTLRQGEECRISTHNLIPGLTVVNSTAQSPHFAALGYGDGRRGVYVKTPDGSKATVAPQSGNESMTWAFNNPPTLDFDDEQVSQGFETFEFQDGPNFFGKNNSGCPIIKGDLYGKLHFAPSLTTLEYLCGGPSGTVGYLEPETYDSLLRWFADLESQGHWNGPVVLGVTTRTKYTTSGQAARTQLVNAGWTITDGGLV